MQDCLLCRFKVGHQEAGGAHEHSLTKTAERKLAWRANVGKRFLFELDADFGVGSGLRKSGYDDALADKAAFPQIEFASFSGGSGTGFAKHEMDAYATTFAG